MYALKSVSRAKISAYRMEQNIMQEKDLLLRLDNPMIMRLVKTFKDADRLYLLTEFIHGIDLFDAIRDVDRVSDDMAMFYTGCLVLALEHLWERDIIHRDLKPENVMVDR
jgi:serine/threonine protein kinase